ncbi:MAG: helix-turn-helix domain-containing protein [Anaerolineaceae bacterium]|nr:helix-turn-helix domain-containing protein [Anaerolineaceae bacterium]
MDTASTYQDLLEQHPIYMTKDQMYRICHISKKTCLYLLEHGLVPCLDSGKKTRRFKIKTTDVIHYLEDRNIHPEFYKPPEGYYKQPHISQPRVLSEHDLLVMRQFYEKELVSWPDVMTIKQVSDFTGYGRTSVVRWCSKQQLKSFYIKRRLFIPKEYLIDFLVSWHFIGISVKSGTHRKLNDQINVLINPCH